MTIWNVYQGTEVTTLGSDSRSPITPVFIGFGLDGQQLVEVRSDGVIRVWQVYRDQVVATVGDAPTVPGGTFRVQAAALSCDARYVAVATYSSISEPKYRVTIWDVERARRLGTLALRDGSEALAFSPDGQWLALTDRSTAMGKRRA